MTQPRIILGHVVVTNPMLETGKIYLHPETLAHIDAQHAAPAVKHVQVEKVRAK
jgi:hypothetical protein